MSTHSYPRILFFGTPGFAVASLQALVEAGYPVIAVVTAPDKPAGRGMQVQEPEVKKYAVLQGIPVLQPEKLRDPAFLETLAGYRADLQVVVAFRMLPEVVWNMPPLGTINVHGSLLPQYRGAAPINRALMHGDTETGVTTFRLKHEIDTGNILLRKRVPITPEDNAGTLHDKLMEAGAALLVRTVAGIADGSLEEIPQPGPDDGAPLRHAPKLFKPDMQIDWNRTVAEIHNHIRGLSPYPGAWTTLNGKTLKIFRSRPLPEAAPAGAPGTHQVAEGVLRFAARDGWIAAEELQMEGKKRMAAAEFLKGFRIA